MDARKRGRQINGEMDRGERNGGKDERGRGQGQGWMEDGMVPFYLALITVMEVLKDG